MSDIYQIIKKLDQIVEAKDELELDPKTGKVTSWSHEGDWKKSQGKDPVGKIHNMSDRAVKKTHELSKDKKVNEGAMKELWTDLQDTYNQLAPGIEKYKDVKGAEELYQALLNVAKQHNAREEFERLCRGARNAAHADYDTNPGSFENWFWYLGLGDDELKEERDVEDNEQVCVYCGDPRDDKFSCCDENHWVTKKEFDADHSTNEGNLNQGAGPKFVSYLKGTDPASKRYSRYVGDSKTQSAIKQGMELVGESGMSEKDIELQDYKSMTTQEFKNAYKMTKQEWINQNKALVIQNPSIKRALGLDEGAEQDPIVAQVVKQMRPGLKNLDMGNEAFLYFAYELGKQRARDAWSDYYPAIRSAYEKGLSEGINEDEVEARWTTRTEDDDGVQLKTHHGKYPSVKAAREAYKKMKPYASDFKYRATKKKKRADEDQVEHFITARPSSKGGPYADRVVMKPEHVTQVPQTGTVTSGGRYEFTESAPVSEDLLDRVKSTFADYLKSVEDEVKDREIQTRKPETRDVQKKELIKDPEVFIIKAKLGPQGEHSAEIKGGFDVYVNGERVGTQLKSVDDAKQALQSLHGQMLETHKGAVASSQAGSPDDYVEE